MTLSASHQTIPVVGTQQRPSRHGTHIHALVPQRNRPLPNFLQPAQLLFTGAAEVYLGNSQWQPVAFPCFFEQYAWSCCPLGTHTHCLYVCVVVFAIASM